MYQHLFLDYLFGYIDFYYLLFCQSSTVLFIATLQNTFYYYAHYLLEFSPFGFWNTTFYCFFSYFDLSLSVSFTGLSFFFLYPKNVLFVCS